MDHIVGGKFKLGKKIGSGSFGELFLGEPSPRPPYSTPKNKMLFFGFLFMLLGRKMLTLLLLLLAAAVNAQTGEEVAVKLVLDSVLPSPSFPRAADLEG
jgi:serine/threonine protein kinase